MKKLSILLIGLLSVAALGANPWQMLKEQRKPFHIDAHNFRSSAKADSATGFDVQKYTINLNISQNPNLINGYVQAEVLAETNLSYITYNLQGLSINNVQVNGAQSTYTHNQGVVIIPLAVQAGETFSTLIAYSGSPQLSGTPYNVGMYFRPTSIFTISDPDAARYWWPCYDHPWDKALIDLIITMRSDWKVAANGLRESIVDHGDGTATTTWRGQQPMTTYLACITAGDYQEIPQIAMQGELPILNFVSPGQYNNALNDLASLPDMINYYSTLFGDYPFEKYGNATVNMSTFGAMEHQTMTTLGNFIINGNGTYELTIAHELVHQWFGNAVSFLDFNDVWLSEGFATYGEHLWMDYSEGWQAACDYVQSSFHQYYLSWENSTNPATIYNPTLSNYFAPPSYEKAASVLHMLRLKMGNTAFFQLLQTYFATYKHGNAVTSEFKSIAESISGQNLQQFFAQWIFGSGIPSVEYEAWYKPETAQLKIQAKSSSPTTTQFVVELPFRVTSASSSDSLLVVADPAGYVNLFEGIAEPTQLLANHNNWTLLRGIQAKQPHLHTCLPLSGSVYLQWDLFGNVTQYNIFRRLAGASSWQILNAAPLTTTSYLDESADNNQTFEYIIRAVDADGFQSMPSALLTAQPVHFSFEYDLLIVDETRDGNGSNISPDDAMVDSFYQSALAPIAYTEWDIATQGFPPLSELGKYKIVFWHDDDLSMNQFHDAEDLLSSYILGGGQAVISGWKTATAAADTFWQRHTGNLEIFYDNPACLISAESSVYPQLLVDASKLASVWNGMLPMISSFTGDFDSLYSGTMVEGSAGTDKSLAFRSGNLNFFGFPLYFMQPAGVRSLLQQLIPQLLETSNEDQVLPAASIILKNYPNPFNPSTEIAFDLPQRAALSLELYNLKGQKLSTLAQGHFQPGKHSVALDASQLSSGVYILLLQADGARITKRITLMK